MNNTFLQWLFLSHSRVFKIKKAFPILVKHLRDGSSESKKQAIWAIQTFGNRKITSVLRKRLKKEKMPDVKDELKMALHYLSVFY